MELLKLFCHISLVIRQKSESQNACYKKTRHAKFSEKRTFLICTRACQRVRTVCFSENLACFVFLNTHFKVRPFALLPTIFLLKYSQVSVSYCSYLLHTVTIPLSPDPSIRTHLINMRWKNHLYIEFQWMSWAELVSEKNIYDDYKVSE